MQKTTNLYHNLGYWFILFIVLVIAGFYSSYLVVILQPKAVSLHIHFLLMMIWIALLITQPFLIKYKKRSLHRKLGRASYVIVPLALISGFWMMRNSYYLAVNDTIAKSETINTLGNDVVMRSVADNIGLPFFYLLWFATFYILAIINRRRSSSHARYMVAAALTLLGPTIDRIFFIGFGISRFAGGIPVESAAFVIADLILVTLLVKDYQHKRPVKTLLVCLSIYVVGQVLYFTLPGTVAWQEMIMLIMKPQ